MRKSKPKLKTTFSRDAPTEPVYHCVRCDQNKPRAEMIQDRKRGSHQHISSWCKQCQAEYMRVYRQTHREQIKLTAKQWRQRMNRLIWRSRYDEPKATRQDHCWRQTEEPVWYALCGLESRQLLLVRSHGESKCAECERLRLSLEVKE